MGRVAVNGGSPPLVIVAGAPNLYQNAAPSACEADTP